MHPAFRIPRAAWGTRTLLCLMLLAVSLRAMIPVGYMPDTAALRQGVLRIDVCTSTGMVSVMQLLRGGTAQGQQAFRSHPGGDHDAASHALDVGAAHDGASHGADTDVDHDGAAQGLDSGLDHDAHDHPGSGHAAGAECPFWAAAHLVLDLPPLTVVPLLTAVCDQAVRFTAPAALLPLSPAGPPLGSRAPPSA